MTPADDVETALAGGNTTPGVVRIGDTVHRPRDHRSAFAADVLRELERLGFASAPRFLGRDDRGRDVLSYVEGATTEHPLQRDERSYAAVGGILRRLHGLTAGIPLAAGGACLVHGDPGPFNVVCRDGMPVALIDWDSVHPGDPMDDLGYGAWTWCLLSGSGVPVSDQARRVRAFRDGYDPGIPGSTVLGAIAAAQDGILEIEARVAADPQAGEDRRAHARRAVAWATADRALLLDNAALFSAAF